MINYVIAAIRLVIFGLIINGLITCFYTFANVPGNYDKPSYSTEEVKALAYDEQSKGIKFAYTLNESNLKYVFIPLLAFYAFDTLFLLVARKKHIKQH